LITGSAAFLSEPIEIDKETCFHVTIEENIEVEVSECRSKEVVSKKSVEEVSPDGQRIVAYILAQVELDAAAV